MNNSFQNVLIKNRILDNSSNKLSKLYYKKFNGEEIIYLNTNGYLSNGYVYVCANSATDLNVYYKDILIFNCKNSAQKLIPCVFEEDTYIKIQGVAQDVELIVFGAEIINQNKVFHLPRCNSLLQKIGGGFELQKYNDYNSLINDDMENNIINYDICDAQTFENNNQYYIGLLINDNGLYFCSNMDNYTNKILIADNAQYAQIMLNGSNVYVIYTIYNQLYYKIIDNNLNLSEEFLIDIQISDRIKGFLSIAITDSDLPIFALKLNNDKIILVALHNSEFKKILAKKAKYGSMYASGSLVELYINNGDCLSICKYNIGVDEDGVSIASLSAPKDFCNVDKVLKLDNQYLLFNDKNCTVVAEDELFASQI